MKGKQPLKLLGGMTLATLAAWQILKPEPAPEKQLVVSSTQKAPKADAALPEASQKQDGKQTIHPVEKATPAALKNEPAKLLPADELYGKIAQLSVVSTDGTLDAEALRQRSAAQAAEIQALSAEFEKRFPNDPRLIEAALLKARLSMLPAEKGGKAADAVSVAEEYHRITEIVDVPVRIRERASRDRLVLLAEEVKAGRMPKEKWSESARAHLEEFPENPSENTAVSTLLSEITEAAGQPAERSTEGRAKSASPRTNQG